MKTAKLFQNGSSQAVRLPKECQFSRTENKEKKFDNIVMLIPKEEAWASMVNSLDHFTDDFMDERSQPEMQTREPLS